MPASTDMKAAGGYNRIKDPSSVAQLMTQPPEFGASQKAFSTWKLQGFPTSQLYQTTTFGRSSTFGRQSQGTVGDTFRYDGAASADFTGGKSMGATAAAMQASMRNPITWQDDEGVQIAALEASRDARRNYVPRPPPTQPPPPPQPQPAMLDGESMQQTWAQLLRQGTVHSSAAQCMVDMPPEYGVELPYSRPRQPTEVTMIGLNMNEGLPQRRDSKFTKEFRDPFL